MINKQVLAEELARALVATKGRYQSCQEQAEKLIEIVDFDKFCQPEQPKPLLPTDGGWYI